MDFRDIGFRDSAANVVGNGVARDSSEGQQRQLHDSVAYVQSVPQEKVRVFSGSFKDFYSFLLCTDCTFEGLRHNHRFVSLLSEVSDITQH